MDLNIGTRSKEIIGVGDMPKYTDNAKKIIAYKKGLNQNTMPDSKCDLELFTEEMDKSLTAVSSSKPSTQTRAGVLNLKDPLPKEVHKQKQNWITVLRKLKKEKKKKSNHNKYQECSSGNPIQNSKSLIYSSPNSKSTALDPEQQNNMPETSKAIWLTPDFEQSKNVFRTIVKQPEHSKFESSTAFMWNSKVQQSRNNTPKIQMQSSHGLSTPSWSTPNNNQSRNSTSKIMRQPIHATFEGLSKTSFTTPETDQSSNSDPKIRRQPNHAIIERLSASLQTTMVNQSTNITSTKTIQPSHGFLGLVTTSLSKTDTTHSRNSTFKIRKQPIHAISGTPIASLQPPTSSLSTPDNDQSRNSSIKIRKQPIHATFGVTTVSLRSPTPIATNQSENNISIVKHHNYGALDSNTASLPKHIPETLNGKTISNSGNLASLLLNKPSKPLTVTASPNQTFLDHTKIISIRPKPYCKPGEKFLNFSIVPKISKTVQKAAPSLKALKLDLPGSAKSIIFQPLSKAIVKQYPAANAKSYNSLRPSIGHILPDTVKTFNGPVTDVDPVVKPSGNNATIGLIALNENADLPTIPSANPYSKRKSVQKPLQDGFLVIKPRQSLPNKMADLQYQSNINIRNSVKTLVIKSTGKKKRNVTKTEYSDTRSEEKTVSTVVDIENSKKISNESTTPASKNRSQVGPSSVSTNLNKREENTDEDSADSRPTRRPGPRSRTYEMDKAYFPRWRWADSFTPSPIRLTRQQKSFESNASDFHTICLLRSERQRAQDVVVSLGRLTSAELRKWNVRGPISSPRKKV